MRMAHLPLSMERDTYSSWKAKPVAHVVEKSKFVIDYYLYESRYISIDFLKQFAVSLLDWFLKFNCSVIYHF